MSRPLRFFPRNVRFYELVIKCAGDQHLMRPDPAAVLRLAQCLRDALDQHRTVQALGFTFLSNHAHLVVCVDDGRGKDISRFMKTMNESIARELNRLRGRRGHFFEGRYRAIPILDEDHLRNRLAYVHAQPVRHKLVRRVENWPGLSSFRAFVEGKQYVEIAARDTASWRAAGAQRSRTIDFITRVQIPLATPPCWRDWDEDRIQHERVLHKSAVRDWEHAERDERKRGRRRKDVNPRRYTRINPFSRPNRNTTESRRPRPWAHGTPAAIRTFRESYRTAVAAFRMAVRLFRETRVLGTFPDGVFPPLVFSPLFDST